MESTRPQHYSSIFKATFLFGFVQIFSIAIKVITSKVVALLLGASGVGVIGLLNSTVRTLQSGAGLGISQSAVRDISSANGSGSEQELSRVLAIVKRLILVVSLLGVVLTVVLSGLLSEWTFGNQDYAVSYVFLSLAVGFLILSEGQLAILKGLRQLRALALASLSGAIVGLLTSLPLIYFFDYDGIVPSIVVAAVSAFIASNYFVRKVKFQKIAISTRQTVRESHPMVVMGFSLMIVTFVGSLSAVVISSFVAQESNLATLGYFQAGVTIINSYFGVITTAMTTDYYPRISEVYGDNRQLRLLVDSQSMVNLTLALPLVVVFQYFSPLFLEVLYSKEFYAAVPFLSYAIFGTVMILCSNNMEMILLAKQKPSIFLLSVIGQRILSTILCVLLFRWYGLIGLGIGFAMQGIVSFIVSSIIMRVKYNITFSFRVCRLLVVVLTLLIGATVAQNIENLWLKYSLGFALITISVVVAHRTAHRQMSINILKQIKEFLKLPLKTK